MGFNYCEYNGGKVNWDGRDIGFVKDVTVTSNVETESLKTSGGGGPLKLRGKKAKEYVLQIKAQIFEVSNPDNMALLLGGGSDPVAIGTTPTTKTAQQLPIAPYQAGSLKAIVLDGKGVSAVTITKTDDTPCVLYTDYWLDAANGIVYIHPTGNLAAASAAKCTYTFTPPTGYKIPYGATFALARKQLVFEHLNEDERIITRHTLWIAEPDGKANFTYTDGSFVMPEITWDAIEDSAGHPTEPFGKVEFLDA